MKKIIAFAGATLLASCASAPPAYDFDKSAMISRDYDTVWSAVSEFFTSNNIQIKTIEKDSGVVYAERINQAPRTPGMIGDVANCGNPGLETAYNQAVQLNVFAKSQGGATRMTVNATMSEMRCSRGVLGGLDCHTVACNSTGRLETSLIEFVRKS